MFQCSAQTNSSVMPLDYYCMPTNVHRRSRESNIDSQLSPPIFLSRTMFDNPDKKYIDFKHK